MAQLAIPTSILPQSPLTPCHNIKYSSKKGTATMKTCYISGNSKPRKRHKVQAMLHPKKALGVGKVENENTSVGLYILN